MTPQEELARAIRVCFAVAGLDFLAAFICAANGRSEFAFFAVLGGIMAAVGMHFKNKAEEIGE